MTGENETKTDIIVPENDSTTADVVEDNEGIDVNESVAEEDVPVENSEDNGEEIATEEEIISEFAPEPIKIPNYNKEKEMRKVEKAVISADAKNAKKRKNSRKRKKMKRIVRRVRNITLFVLLLVVTVGLLSSLLVKLNMSKHSINTAIRACRPEEFIVGRIKEPEKINLKTSSQNASIADILRDNSMVIVSYADIREAVARSGYPDFVASAVYNIANYFIYGNNYKELTEKDIAQALMENTSYIKLVTGRELGESACKDLAKYISKSDVFKEISFKNVSTQKATKYTDITSVLFSTIALVCFIIALMLMIVFTAICCKGYAHKMIGWAVITAGAVTSVIGFLYKPMFKASGAFIKCVLDALEHGFMQSALVCSAVALLIGVFVMLIGKAMTDDDDDEYEQGYIDEIEKTVKAK